MSALPFLKPKAWPTERKLSGTSRYGYSEDDDIIDQALDELDQALKTKDHSLFLQALTAIINCIKSKEHNAEPHE